MTIAVALIFTLVLALAWANGANDIAKGIATLVGNGSTNAKKAVLWGTAWTILGGLAAIIWGSALVKNFSSGYLAPEFQVTLAFVASTLIGAAGWVVFATRFALPVSTTHALLGGLIGAALVNAGADGLRTAAVTNKALLPLLVSPLIAILLCAVLLMIMRMVAKKVPAWVPGCCDHDEWRKNPFACASANNQLRPSVTTERVWTAMHWISSGSTSFARGLNDVPKIAAFLILVMSLAPGSFETLDSLGKTWPIILVAFVMGMGSLWGGFRVLSLLAHRITPLDASSGLIANAGTSMLVLIASPFGLPVSTTHVSTGALMGVRWTNKLKPQRADALKLVLFGWVITLPVAAALAALSALAL